MLRTTALPSSTHAIALLVLVGALVYAGVVHLATPILPEDDAYITYRYVSNLFAGEGLVYNQGERVFGSTTPLYTAWLSILQSAFREADLPALAVRFNLVWYVASVLTITRLMRHITGSAVPCLLVGAGIAANPMLLDISLGGMEPYLFAFLGLGALVALTEDKPLLAALAAGMAAVTRPEGLFVLGIWGFSWLRSRRPLLPVAMALLPLGIWCLFAVAYYGTPVPHSVIAKSTPLYVIPLRDTLAMLLQVHALCIMGLGWERLPKLAPALAMSLPVIIGTWTVMRRPRTLGQGAWRPVLLSWLLLALYLRPNTLVFSWYIPIVYFCWACTALAALLPIARGLQGRAEASRWRTGLSSVALAVPLLLSPLASAQHIAPYGGLLQLPLASGQRLRVLALAEAATWLDEQVSGAYTVAAPEIGAVGYYSRAHIYDGCGLVSPQALPYLPTGTKARFGAISAEFVQSVGTDFVITLDNFARYTLLVDPWFLEHYHLIKTVPLEQEMDAWAAYQVLVYARSDR